VKRDDAIAFAFGGNKVRKLALVAADALAGHADTLITCGGIQSNHARVTACTAARLGLRCVLVVNGERPSRPTGNALLDALAGADVRYVSSRDDRVAAMDEAADEVRRNGGRPYVIPLGASTPLGAAAFVDAVTEMLAQIAAPDVIVHASSSGGTQAGLVAGCALAGAPTRIIGISADDPAPALRDQVRLLMSGLVPLLGVNPDTLASAAIEVDDGWVGEGYGVPTAESREAIELTARTEGLFLDPTYTAKAMAALIGRVRGRQLGDGQTVLFWHTGGQPALFA
jgi:1-aminocyclopropane-1-carboxylate deaminase/D-cysteine desulfhydrase-like pyridoxal-dependent ACC family enzyme